LFGTLWIEIEKYGRKCQGIKEKKNKKKKQKYKRDAPTRNIKTGK